MVNKNQDAEMYAGNKRSLQFTISDEDTTGSPAKDLSGLTVKFALSLMDSSGNFQTTPTVEKTTDNSGEITISGSSNEIATVVLVPADTSALAGDYYMELEAFDGTPAGIVLATGTLTIIRNVTNT